MKVAITHDWLTNLGGAEKVVLALHRVYPTAPIYTSVFNPLNLANFNDFDIRTSFIQKLPLAKSKHQLFALLRWQAFARFDLSEYNVVIASSSAESKGIKVGRSTTLICYCHTPTRYYWSDYKNYLANPGFGWLNPVVKVFLPKAVKRLRKLDYNAAQRVDYFIANSNFVAKRIKKYYGKDSTVIYPPVNVDKFKLGKSKRRGFLVLGRQIPYKRLDLAVKACSRLKLPLLVVGDGSEHNNLRKLAGPTIRFIKNANDNQILVSYQQAQALIFPGREDFGIVPVEAMACGTPVIAFSEGGATESVNQQSGIFFKSQTVDSLMKALKRFDQTRFDPKLIRKQAEQFSEQRFRREIEAFVRSKFISDHRHN